MAKQNYDDKDGVWRTVGGRRIFIKNGESLDEAMKNSKKFNTEKDKKDDTSNGKINLSDTDKQIVEDALKDTIKEWKDMGDVRLEDLRTNDVIRTLNRDMNGFLSDENKADVGKYIAILMRLYHVG